MEGLEFDFLSFEELATAADEKFRGEITIDETVESDDRFNGGTRKQWHIGVTPFGASKAVQAWYNAGSRGQIAQVAAAIAKVFGTKDAEGNPLRPGQGQLLGLMGEFQRKAFSYTDKTTGERKEARNPNLIAIRKVDAPEGYTAVAAPTGSYSSEDVIAMLGLIDGRKNSEYFKDVIKADLSQNVKNALLSSEAADYLVATGYATRDGDVVRATDKALTLA